MGICFAAVLEHRLSHMQLVSLPNALQENIRLAESILDLERALQTFYSWDMSPWFRRNWTWDNIDPSGLDENDIDAIWAREDQLPLIGPAAATIYFGSRSCELVHWISWFDFLKKEEIRSHLRRVCHLIAIELIQGAATSSIIYVPDSGYGVTHALDWSNQDVSWIAQWMQEQHGPPADTIEKIFRCEGDFVEGDGYFIDNFEDYPPHSNSMEQTPRAGKNSDLIRASGYAKII